MSIPIQVLIVDDKEQVRKDLRTLLALHENIEVVGEAANGVEAIRLIEKLKPAVILLDLEMPLMDGYEAIKQIKTLPSSPRIIVLTVHGYAAASQKALQAGADSFIVKGTTIENLIQAIIKSKS